MEILHEIDFGNGYVSVPEPNNFEGAEVDIIFTKDTARASLANLTLVWKGETAGKIFKIYEQGASGGKGVSSSLPYRITVCGKGLIFNLMLVMGHSSTRLSCDQVELPAWQAQGADWFEKETQGYSFWHLYKNLKAGDKGKINFSDFKQTPYTVTSIPNYIQVLSLSFQELVLIWKLRELILNFTDNTTEAGADLGESAIPVVGTPHIIVTVTHIARIVIRVVEIVGYMILIAKFFKELENNFIQGKKYKLCMLERTLFEKMCEFLNLNFSSSIYAPSSKFYNATWMPEKVVMPKTNPATFLNNLVASMFDRPEDEANNPKSFGYFDGLFSQFVETMERKYNAEGKIINGSYVFEKKNSFNSPSFYQLPNTTDGGYTFNLPAPFRTNLSELAPYYEVSFQTDASELNTIHRYRGTSAAVQILTPFPVTKYSGWGQGALIDLGSALGKRKEYLTKEEEFVNGVVNVIHTIASIVIAPINLIISGLNAVIKGLNAILKAWNLIAPSALQVGTIGLINQIQNPIPFNLYTQRIGWLELSGDSFGVPKTFIGVNVGGDWELHPNTETDMSAITLFNDCHGSNLATRGGQYILYDRNQSKFCCEEFFQIFLRNVLKTPDGNMGKFDTMKWKLKSEKATEIEWREQKIYLTGLSEKLIIDGTP